jgi:hypothetical protein
MTDFTEADSFEHADRCVQSDFITRRRAAIQAERERFADWLLEDELEHELKIQACKHDAEIEREREKRRKYREAMAGAPPAPAKET